MGSNEYPQSMFLIRNKKNNVYPCKPQFYYIKVGFTGHDFVMSSHMENEQSFSPTVNHPVNLLNYKQKKE